MAVFKSIGLLWIAPAAALAFVAPKIQIQNPAVGYR